MKKLILIYCLSVISLFALQTPKPALFDKTMVYANFNKDDVFQLYAKDGYTTLIQFAKDEIILDMATGFSAGWDIQDRRNYIFIKPKAYESSFSIDDDGEVAQKKTIIQPNKETWKTNLIVLTNKKEYVFNLNLKEEKETSHFKLTFNYPKDEMLKEEKRLQKEKQKNEEAEIIAELNRNAIPKNWDYKMYVNKQSENIAPSFAYDDGQFTYLGFDSTKDMPSAFLYENDKESILNTHIKKDGNYDVLVIQKTAKQIVLRSGERVVGILNSSFGVNTLQEVKTTNSPNLQREVIDYVNQYDDSINSQEEVIDYGDQWDNK